MNWGAPRQPQGALQGALQQASLQHSLDELLAKRQDVRHSLPQASLLDSQHEASGQPTSLPVLLPLGWEWLQGVHRQVGEEALLQDAQELVSACAASCWGQQHVVQPQLQAALQGLELWPLQLSLPPRSCLFRNLQCTSPEHL